MYSKVNTDMNFVEREKEVEEFWKEDNTFKKSMEQREGCPTYTFYDGPVPWYIPRLTLQRLPWMQELNLQRVRL